MTSSLGHIRRRVFGLSPDEATFARRGFHESDPQARQRLEGVGYTFLKGYHAALEESRQYELAARLNAIDRELQGFAFEGAAMALALLDMLTPWTTSRWQAFLNGSGKDHIYMIHVGLGWALARLHRRVERPLSKLDPLLGWLVLDGYGFHEGYFYPTRYVDEKVVLTKLSGYALHAFDQGLGRSLWFSQGADVSRIPDTIAAFPQPRHADLWSGVGLACAYAGGVDRASLEALREAAGQYKSHLGQGAAFAAKARLRAGNPTPHTELACRVMCNMSAEDAAGITDFALVNLSDEGTTPAFEIWRQRIRAQVGKETVAV